jgi:hypothetical protein
MIWQSLIRFAQSQHYLGELSHGKEEESKEGCEEEGQESSQETCCQEETGSSASTGS